MESSKNQDDRHCTKVCVECGSSTTSMEKTKWGIYPHWYGTIERPICKKCYVRKKWQEKYVPKGVKCDRCGKETLIVTKYGTQIWVRDKKKKNVYYCKGCFVILRDTGQIRSYEARENIGIGIHKALNKGVIFGKTKYTLDNTVFDTTTEESAYWSGFLMSDGNISYEKTGNARIALTLAKVDYSHIEKFRDFLKCTNPIKPKKKKYRGAIVNQYYLRFTSKHIAEILISYGIVPRKSLIARAIGLENNNHFWRGVFDGDGYFKNKDGKDADKMILTGSNDLCVQFEEYIKKTVPDAKVKIKKIQEYSKLYLSSDTARAVAKLLYSDCKIALERKLVKARTMIQWGGIMMNKSGLDIHTTKGFQDLRSCSVTDLLKLCEDRNSLLRDDDRLIERVVEQLSEYEQVLYDKDVYIKELEDELIQTQNASIYKEESL